MPSVQIETCYLKDILNKLSDLPSHNWLISNLECYDHCNWEGSEKWAETDLFLTDEQLRKDVDFRNMQIIWGAFSAIPVEYSKEKVYSYELPWLENPYYMRNFIEPQHPLAILEISVFDGWYTIVSSKDAELIKPLYELEIEAFDEEYYNQKMNGALCRVQDMLRSMIPNVSDKVANEVQWRCWNSLLKNRKREVNDKRLSAEIMKHYMVVNDPKYIFKYTYWDPYTQK